MVENTLSKKERGEGVYLSFTQGPLRIKKKENASFSIRTRGKKGNDDKAKEEGETHERAFMLLRRRGKGGGCTAPLCPFYIGKWGQKKGTVYFSQFLGRKREISF